MTGEHNSDPKKWNRRIIGLILLGILIWSGVITWGVVRNQPTLELGKPLVVFGVFALFVFVWLALLATRTRKK